MTATYIIYTAQTIITNAKFRDLSLFYLCIESGFYGKKLAGYVSHYYFSEKLQVIIIAIIFLT